MEKTKNVFRKSFKFDFFFRFLSLIVIEALCIFLFFMVISNNTYTVMTGSSGIEMQNTAIFFFFPFIIVCAITAVAVALAGMLSFFLLSSKISTPMAELTDTLTAITSGDLTKRCDLSEPDLLDDVKGAVNGVAVKADDEIYKIQTELMNIQNSLASKEGEEANNEVRDALSNINSEISKFNITPK